MYGNNKIKYIAGIILFSFIINNGFCLCAPSRAAADAVKLLKNDLSAENVNNFVKVMEKESKKAKRKKEYDEAADYLRAALYFLQQKPDSVQYKELKSQLDEIIQLCQIDTSESNRLEIAKNLYLEGKYFASAYEFSILLKENYEKDVCFEYLGDIAQKTDNLNDASILYKKAMDINPLNLNVRYKYANFLLQTGKSDAARLYFEDVIEGTNNTAVINDIITTFTKRVNQNPDDENNYGILGLSYQKLGEYEKTYKLLRKSIILNPDDIFLQYYLANLLFNINEFDFADEIYTEILEKNPYESQIRISRAKTYNKLGKTDKALKDYQIVLAMYPDSLQAQLGMYNLLKKNLPLEKIINLFYPLEPDYKLDYAGYMDLGYIANKTGQTDDAIIFFKKANSINPKGENSYIELYKAYQLSGKFEAAKNILNSAYKLFPKSKEISDLYKDLNSKKIDEKNNLALSYLNEGDYQKAITIYNQIEPKTFETYEAIANCYRQLGDFKNAIVNYNKSISMNPDDSEIYYALGVTYLETNDLNKAKNAFSTSLAKNKNDVKSKKMLSVIEQKELGKDLDAAYELYDKKDYNGALRLLNKSAQAFPDDAKIYYYRGLTKDALGDYNGAVEDLRLTIKNDRNYTIAYFKLGEFLEKTNKKKEALYMYEKYLGAADADEELAKIAQKKVIELGERYY